MKSSGPPPKLLLIANSPSPPSTFTITSLQLPDKNNNFPTPLDTYTTLPFAPSSETPSTPTPTAVWDSAANAVLLATRRADGHIALLTLRSGRIIGEIAAIPSTTTSSATTGTDAIASQDPPSLILHHRAPLLAFRQGQGSGIAASCKANPTSSSGSGSGNEGKWLIQPLLGPLGEQLLSSNGPVLCTVGLNWVYVFWFDETTGVKGKGNVFYHVIDAKGLAGIWAGPSEGRRVAWNPYVSTVGGGEGEGGFVGVPAVVVTGSSSTNWFIHIFGVTASDQLRYLSIPLYQNGQPCPTAYHTNTTQANPSVEQLVCSTAGGPISAVAHQGTLYVFCTQMSNGKTVVACWWRKVEGKGGWTQSKMPRIAADNDPMAGGVSAVFVQADF
ncbi:hypothetical protein MMC10_009914 [Thelotrema lepadinum]|nr:hypothetical protein [Thelotrema lepadinum]